MNLGVGTWVSGSSVSVPSGSSVTVCHSRHGVRTAARGGWVSRVGETVAVSVEGGVYRLASRADQA